MSAEWDSVIGAVEGRVHPDRRVDDFAQWESQLLRAEPVESKPESQPWWVACGISTAGAVFACGLCFVVFVISLLASGGH